MEAKHSITHDEAEGYIADLKNPEVGGFTHRNISTGSEPSEKIMVSIQGAEARVPLDTITPEDILDYQRSQKGHLLHPEQFFGGWAEDEVPGTTRHAALDVSRGVPFAGPNRDKMAYSEAMRQAAIHQQKAVYDPRKRAAQMFPKNPHYGKDVPEAHSRSEWDYKWLVDNPTGSLEGGHWYPD